MDREHKKEYKMLGLNIAYYRKLRGYTQQTLAEALGIDRTHMGAVEQANAGASLDLIFRLCKILDVPPQRLFEFRE